MSNIVRFGPAVLFVLFVLVAGPAIAHTGGHEAGGFLAGFEHPITGWDHVAAMVAVGLWGAFLGAPALWVLPVVFPLIMAFGGALAIFGTAMPSVELAIAASALVIGALVAFAARPSLWIAAPIVAFFAIFHGYAHGLEMPNAAHPAAYAAGFVIGTGLLHLLGIGLGSLSGSAGGRIAVRAGGAAVAVAGLVFVVGVLG